MNPFEDTESQIAEEDYRKREKKINKYVKDLFKWISVSIMLVALNIFLVGGLTWAKWPVGIWGIVLLSQGVEIYRLYKLNKIYQQRRWQQGSYSHPANEPDYSDELMNPKKRKEKESVYRDGKNWKDEDLV